VYDAPVYLDHAAATPLDPRVFEAMRPYVSDAFFNPSSPYAPAVAVRRDYEAARARIARVLGMKPDEITFTSGATESINLAFHSVLHGGGTALIPSIEHHAVLAAANLYDHHVIVPTALGEVTPEAVAAMIGDDTRLISVALANNELGTIQPLREIAAVIKSVREKRRENNNPTPLYLHTDASQGAGLLELSPAKLGVDLMTLNAGKMYGPKGVGLLWADSHVELKPLLVGGGQERGLRSGTENVSGVIGFSEALERAEKGRKENVRSVGALRNALENQLREAFRDVVITKAPAQLANFLQVAWPGLDAERIVFMLENSGILVATGSACAANSNTRSHVLTAIGMAPTLADGSLRLTLGKLNDQAGIARAGAAIIDAVQRERERTA
jgi:cysteine desulfurase